MSKVDPLSKYELHFYGTGFEDNPQRIISLKNNQEVLGACILPKTKQQLSQLNINISDNQIALLQKWRLLDIQNGKLQTIFPILSKDKISQLRKYTDSLATVMTNVITPEINRFLQSLEKQYMTNAYILLFAYVLDGLIWDYFTKANLMPDMSTDTQKLWVGVLWGSYLPRKFFLGTNTYEVPEGEVTFIWNNTVLPKLKPFFLHEESIPQKVKNLTIPIIWKQSGDPTYESGKKVAKKLSEEVLHQLNLPALAKQYNLYDQRQALVIIYHELMWSILEEIENKKLVPRPAILVNPKETSKADVANLMFQVNAPK